MDPYKTFLEHQYLMVQDARNVLLDFISGISEEHLVGTARDVGNGGSIKNLLIHVANSYFGWLSHFALGRPFDKMSYDAVQNLATCITYFSRVDQLMEEFLNEFAGCYEQPVTGTIANGTRTVNTTPLQVFMHVTTHEFHHKGQILVLSRHWGYTPVDTDILR